MVFLRVIFRSTLCKLRWPRRAMSITDFNFFHFQFGNFSLPISNLQIYHYQFHFFVLPISNLYISCYQIENFSLPNWIFLVSNLDISHNLPIIHTRTRGAQNDVDEQQTRCACARYTLIRYATARRAPLSR